MRLFESGLRFRQDGDALHQEPMLAGVIVGLVLPEQWGATGPDADLFDLKADVEALLAAAGCAGEAAYCAAAHPALHPGQSARIERAGKPVGWLGSIHPSLAAALDLPVAVQLFELETAALGGAPRPAFLPLSKFPSIRRDIAIVVDRTVAYAHIEQSVRTAAGDLLRELILFDVYVGEKVDSSRKSIALGLILQATSQTLTDDDVAAVMARVLAALRADLAAQLRS